MLFKSKETPNASSPMQHKKIMAGNGLRFQRSLNAILMSKGRTERKTSGIPTWREKSRMGKWRQCMAL